MIDALHYPKVLARYANDARGLSKVGKLVNNCKYVEEDRRVFMEAIKEISAGSELLIGYGKEYWDIIKKFMYPPFASCIKSAVSCLKIIE